MSVLEHILRLVPRVPKHDMQPNTYVIVEEQRVITYHFRDRVVVHLGAKTYVLTRYVEYVENEEVKHRSLHGVRLFQTGREAANDVVIPIESIHDVRFPSVTL